MSSITFLERNDNESIETCSEPLFSSAPAPHFRFHLARIDRASLGLCIAAMGKKKR